MGFGLRLYPSYLLVIDLDLTAQTNDWPIVFLGGGE